MKPQDQSKRSNGLYYLISGIAAVAVAVAEAVAVAMAAAVAVAVFWEEVPCSVAVLWCPWYISTTLPG
mgnify:CR=1 FL=1